MPSFADSAIIFVLALLLFGPEKLPKLARELGKWIGEFRRASNEFKMQMEDELRIAEQAEREKKLATIEATAPASPALPGIPTDEPEHPHSEPTLADISEPDISTPAIEPIASSGDLHLMPPATGLPVSRNASSISPLIDSIPVAESAVIEPVKEPEHASHD